MAAPLLDLFAREHPAWIHLPLGAVLLLPVALLLGLRKEWEGLSLRMAFFLALMALMGSGIALLSGLMWAHRIALIAPGAWLPGGNPPSALQALLRGHEFAALLGFGLGLACLGALLRHLRDPGARGAGWPARILAFAWLGAWGLCGRLGGVMVFGNEETTRAAAAAEAAKREDAEAELPVRALDFASLEPASERPFRSAAHGHRWGRVWVTASGIDAYRAGKPLPPGAYAVLATVEDEKGRPGPNPGPLYMRETGAGGEVLLSFYWPRVPEGARRETGGEDSAYWRNAHPGLNACRACHRDAGRAEIH